MKLFPNPLSESSDISINFLKDENFSLKIYDLTGHLVRNLTQESVRAGSYTYTWDADDEKGNQVSDGIYLLQLVTSASSQMVRLTVVRNK